jgi:hypothetical protein
MTNTHITYFTEIEEHFRRVRGTGSCRLSPSDWALIKVWQEAGISAEAVLRGIDRTFEKWRGRSALARTQRVNSLAYCKPAIIAEARATAPTARVVGRPPAPPLPLDQVRAFVTRNADMLRQSGNDDLADSLETLDLATLYCDLEQLEQSLIAVEESLIARLRSSASEEVLCEARRAMALELKPYRGKMTTEQIALLEKQLLERRLLKLSGLPRLSLFYLGDHSEVAA